MRFECAETCHFTPYCMQAMGGATMGSATATPAGLVFGLCLPNGGGGVHARSAPTCYLLPACLPAPPYHTSASARRCTGDEHTTKPWIAPHVDTPAARDPEPGQARKRPYIYVYELPGKFNSHMLQVCCSTRIFMRCASSLLDCTAR